jgi:hypothetical protein
MTTANEAQLKIRQTLHDSMVMLTAEDEANPNAEELRDAEEFADFVIAVLGIKVTEVGADGTFMARISPRDNQLSAVPFNQD